MDNSTDLDVYLQSSVRDWPAFLPCLAVVQALILLGSLIGNLVVFVVFYKKQRLLSPSNRLILNLALTNFLMAVLVMPTVIVSLVTDRWLFGDAWCQVVGLLNSVFFSACIFTLVLISLDRYVAVVTPLHYRTRVTQTRTHVAVAVVWLLSLLISIPPMFGWSRFTYHWKKHTCTVNWKSSISAEKIYTFALTIVCFCTPFILMLWVYITIFHAAKANNKRTRRRSSVVDLPESRTNGRAINTKNGSSRRPSIVLAASTIGQVFRKDEWKAAKTSLIIVSAFLICWAPYFVIIILESLLDKPESIPWALESVSVLLMLLDCMLNPIVYTFRNTIMRYEIGKMIQRKRPEYTNGVAMTGIDEEKVCVTNGHCRFSRRAMSLPSPTSNLNLNGILRHSVPALPESDHSLSNNDDPQLWSYLDRCRTNIEDSEAPSSMRVTFKTPSTTPNTISNNSVFINEDISDV